MVEMIESWMERVNQRKDLLPSWRERQVTLEVNAPPVHNISLIIDQNGVKLGAKQDQYGKIHLTSTPEIVQEILQGNRKLTALSKDTIDITGNYRNVLFLESLFLLSK